MSRQILSAVLGGFGETSRSPARFRTGSRTPATNQVEIPRRARMTHITLAPVEAVVSSGASGALPTRRSPRALGRSNQRRACRAGADGDVLQLRLGNLPRRRRSVRVPRAGGEGDT